jgi:hypothetical protein
VPESVSRSKESLFVIVALGGALLSYLILGFAITRNLDPSPKDAGLFMPLYRSWLQPEPGEKRLFLLGLLCIPTLPTAFYWLLWRWDNYHPAVVSWLTRPWLLNLGNLLLIGGAGAWLLVLAVHSEIPEVVPSLLGAVGLSLLLFFGMRGRDLILRFPRWVVTSVAFVLTGFVAWLLVLNHEIYFSRSDIWWHLEAPLGAVLQATHGKTVMVDFDTQYGIIYPYLAAWILSPWGLSIASVSVFFAVMGFLSLWFIYLALDRQIGRGSLWAMLFLAGLLGVWSPFFASAIFHFQASYAAYQFFPLRILWGAFFFWFASVYFHRKHEGLLLLGYLAAGFSVLWNMDTGLVILIAWTGTLVFDAVAAAADLPLRRKLTRAVLHGIYAALALALSVATYAAWARLRSGQWSHLDSFYKYQALYYGSGFGMLPMRLWEFWQPLVLVYAVTVFSAIRRLLRGDVDATVNWNLFVALYGLGIFSYYQGRSTGGTLICVCYPAYLLAGGWFAKFLPQLRSASMKQIFSSLEVRSAFLKLAACAILLFFGIINLVRFSPEAMGHAFGLQPPARLGAYPEPNPKELAAFRQYLAGSETLILSPVAGYFHLQTGSFSPLPFACLGEAILQSQADEVQKVMDHRDIKYVLIDEIAFGYPITQPLMSQLRFNHYRAIGKSSHLVLLQRTP